jgi:hypothetical protein
MSNPIETVDIHGKEHPTYAGVLAKAHENGLFAIQTKLIQAPLEENRFMAIVHAKVTVVTDDKITKVFEGIGDATPKNVNRMIAPHIVRMAETRAKGRALRDALNIGQALKEELDDAEPEIYDKAQSKGSGRTYPCPECGAPPGRMHATGCKYRK